MRTRTQSAENGAQTHAACAHGAHARTRRSRTCPHVPAQVGKDYVKLLKYGDSLYRCKALKRAALGRMCTIMKRQKGALEYLEQVAAAALAVAAADADAVAAAASGRSRTGIGETRPSGVCS